MINSHSGLKHESLSNTRVIRKKPQSKLSYLKKLFAKNTDNQTNMITLSNGKEIKHYQASYHASFLNTSLIANQPQYAPKQLKQSDNYKCGYLYGHQNAKKIDNVIQRYKQSNKSNQKNNEDQIFKQVQKNRENRQTHSFFYRKKNIGKQKNNLSIIQNNKFTQQNYYKQLKKEKYENWNEEKNYICKQNKKNQSFYGISGKECQNNGCGEIDELIKIEKILKKIKREIKINRSIILNGFQQLKYINLSSIHQNNKINSTKNRYTNHYQSTPLSQPHQYRKHSNSQILKAKNHNKQNPFPKPSIIYNYSYKIK